jgi:hypothetical protein
LRKRERHFAYIRFAHQLPAHAARDAIGVEVDVLALVQRHLHRKCLAALANAFDQQARVAGVVEEDAAEVHAHLFFHGTQHHLEDAGQVLPLADGARDLVQQVEAFQLCLLAQPGLLALGDVAEQHGNAPPLRCANAVCANMEMAVVVGALFVPLHRLASEGYPAIDLQPAWFQVRDDLGHAAARGGMEA